MRVLAISAVCYRSIRLTLAGCTIGLAPVAGAQRVPIARLMPADVTLDAEFVRLMSVRELSDGRVLLSDDDQGIVVADFRTRTVRPIGRRGQGPGEYSYAAPLRSIGLDSSIMTDAASRRWILYDRDSAVITIPPDAPIVTKTEGITLGADALGHVMTYWRPRPRQLPVTLAADSDRVLLIARSTAHADTVARLRQMPTRTVQRRDDQGNVSIASSRGILRENELAELATDGWLAIARIEPYRIDWRSPDGRLVRGAPIPLPVIRMDAREKRAYMARGARSANRPARSPDTIDDWPETIPPFRSPFTLTTTPDGRVLVRKEPSADHPEPLYDVVDREGKLVAQIALAANERILGVSAKSVYVVVKDQDDIERVRRHPWWTNRAIAP